MNTVMELEIGPGPEPGSYVVHVLRSVGGGEPSQTITLDLDELVARRPLLEATVLSSSVSARRVMSDTEAVVQEVGRRLFDSTFSGDGPHRLPHEHGGRLRARHGRADRAAPHRARASRRCRGRRSSTPRPAPTCAGRNRSSVTCRRRTRRGRPGDRAADAGARHDLLAARPARARRRRRARTTRGGPAAAPRLGTGRTGVARRGDVDGRARQAARGAVARAALRRARHVRRGHRRGRARVRRTRRPRRLRHRLEPRGPARRGRADAPARRAELVPVGRGRNDRPVLGHRRGARPQRHPRGRRHAVLHQRHRRDRVRSRLLHGPRARPRHRRGGAERPHRHPRHGPRHARVGHARAVPARRGHAALRRGSAGARGTRDAERLRRRGTPDRRTGDRRGDSGGRDLDAADGTGSGTCSGSGRVDPDLRGETRSHAGAGPRFRRVEPVDDADSTHTAGADTGTSTLVDLRGAIGGTVVDGAARTTAACRRSYRPAACEAAERCRLGHRISDHSTAELRAAELRAAEPTAADEPWRASPVDAPLEAVARRGCRVDRRHRGRDRDDLPASSAIRVSAAPRSASSWVRPTRVRTMSGRRMPSTRGSSSRRTSSPSHSTISSTPGTPASRVPNTGSRPRARERCTTAPPSDRRGSATERARSRRPTRTRWPHCSSGVRGSDTLELVGSDGTYTCPSTAEMKLTVNDVVNLGGNAGQFRAKIFLISGG